MAEQKDEKSKLPLTGVMALLLAVVSSLIIYQVPLKTSRPIDKEAEKAAFVGADRVQSRLWQDPFEAVATHRLKEASQSGHKLGADHHHEAKQIIEAIRRAGAQQDFGVLPVLVDGSPYASGAESRLRDRYAVVSALGAAGYLPESGEYIRYFEWQRALESPVVVPVEWFVLRPRGGEQPKLKQVLVLWLKDQDLGSDPLLSLGRLLKHINCALEDGTATYRVLGPRSSGSLRAMVSELKARDFERAAATARPSGPSADPGVEMARAALKGLVFYSSWATAADPFLLGDVPQETGAKTVEGWFADGGMTLVRTIETDAVLAEKLVEELKRRQVDLTVSRDGEKVPHIALIAEWDTLYGRVLPRTFIAAANWKAERSSGKGDHGLAYHIDALRAEIYPPWVHRYSYLAGLDGELPPKNDEKEPAGSQAKGKIGDSALRMPQTVAEAPAGRSQLDYLRRLVETLKYEEATKDGEFEAIGVLGSDVYDKLMILQALRSNFPHALFFTTDLDARLTHPSQSQWTRNLIIASHFGLELHPKLQTPIPPFRDSYQTALFYSALRAVDYLQTVPGTNDLAISSQDKFSGEVKPRLYEVGRHGAVDISPDGSDQPSSPENVLPSIHLPRPDVDPATGELRLPDVGTVGWAVSLLGALMVCALLLNSQFLELFTQRRHRSKLFFMLAVGAVMALLLLWAMRDEAAGEPFSFTEGVSVWPTAIIRFFALVLCVVFLYYSSLRLRENDRALGLRFGLLHSKAGSAIPLSLISIHNWRPRPAGAALATDIWQEYQTLGQWTHRLARILPQTLGYGFLGWCLMKLFGAPTVPCRGATCFEINFLILLLSVFGMTLLMFYVVDATRLCRRLIKIMLATKIRWPDELLAQEAKNHAVDSTALNEWLGIDLIAQRTAVISFMLYYPFVILFLMGVARHTYFDRWDFPVSLMVVFGLNALYALGNAVYLRRSAEEAKHAAIAQLRAQLIGGPGESAKGKQIEQMAALIENNREGAFLPFTQHPLFGAIALPTGGTGLVLLVEYLATIF